MSYKKSFTPCSAIHCSPIQARITRKIKDYGLFLVLCSPISSIDIRPFVLVFLLAYNIFDFSSTNTEDTNMPLSNAAVENLKPKLGGKMYRVADGKGLCVEVTPVWW